MQAARGQSATPIGRRGKAQSHLRQGIQLQRAGHLVQAADAFAAAIRLDPSHPDAFRLQADALGQAGQHEAALAVLLAAAQRHPQQPGLLTQTGRVLLRLGRDQQAVGALLLAVERAPGDAEALTALGIAFLQCGALDQAQRYTAQAFQLDPSYENAVNLSRVLLDAGLFEAALAASLHAVERQPGSLAARNNHALALEGLGRYEQAVAAWEAALALAPQDTGLCHKLSTLLLGLGRMTPQAWALYERRLDDRGAVAGIRRWRGEDVAGKTVLLHAEQGFGDTLHFVRYAPMVAARGARVVLAVQPSLVRLLAATPGVDQVVAVGGALPAFDVFCPLLSLPALFQTDLDSIPLPLPLRRIAGPRARGGLRVGLVWAGNPGFVNDRQRSIDPSLLAPLTRLPGLQCISLQWGQGAVPQELDITPGLMGAADFADTADRIAGLDLVVAVDTAVAHLAATMGKPVWLLSRYLGCWRWLLDRADSPWYPSMRIYRQSAPNDWEGVVGDVTRDLGAWSATGGAIR